MNSINTDSLISHLPLTRGTIWAMKRVGIKTVGDVLDFSYAQLLHIPGVGPVSATKIQDCLISLGLTQINNGRIHVFDTVHEKYLMASDATLRDYFAAKAMQAIIAADGTYEYKARAIEAYQAADAMLEARKS